MKKLKKAVALGLASVTAVSVMACQAPAKENSQSQESQEETAKVTSGEETAGKEENKEVNTYTLMGQQGATSGDWNNYWIFDKIEEDLGMKFDITMVSTEGLQEKKNLALASGEYPDFFLAGILTEEDIATYSAQGVFIPLEDYINEEYTPNLVAAFEKYPELKASLYYPDGHIYNITGLNASKIAANRFLSWINVDWCEKLGMEVPKTLDEYYEYLVGVKNNDLNGNGQNDEIPMGGRYNTEYFRNLTPILTALGMAESTYEVVDGKVRYNPAEPVYKEFLTYMNKLWSEGLIDPEYFTQSEEQYFAKQVQNQYGVFADYASWVRMYNEEDVWGQYDAWDPMTSEYNDEQMWPAYSVSPLGAFVITNKCENPQDLMRLVDWFYDTEHSDWSIQGVPVGMWPDDPEIGWTTKDVEGGREVVQTWPEEYEDYQTFNHQLCTADYGTFPNIPSSDLVATGPQKVLEDAMWEHLSPYYKVGWPTMKYTAEEAEEIALIQVDVTSYTDQMFSKFVTGEVSLDEFDTFVQGLKDRNLDRLLEIQQQVYDRWASNGK